MEELLALIEWEETLRWGAGEYFNTFYDWFPDDGSVPDNPCLANREQAALSPVSQVMSAACDATPKSPDDEEFKASGWPQRISPIAKQALRIMVERGRFSEEREEDEPANPGWSAFEPYSNSTMT
jgi:hypothetical protein